MAKDLIANDEAEIGEVVRRRLFEHLGPERNQKRVAKMFADWCFERRAQLPPEWTAVDTATTEAKAKVLTVKAEPEPTPVPSPEPSPQPLPWPDPGPSASSTPEPSPAPHKHTLRLVGTIPPEVWNRLGTKVLPKLRTGSDLRVDVDLSVSLDTELVQSMVSELRQILQDLDLEDRLRIAQDDA